MLKPRERSTHREQAVSKVLNLSCTRERERELAHFLSVIVTMPVVAHSHIRIVEIVLAKSRGFVCAGCGECFVPFLVSGQSTFCGPLHISWATSSATSCLHPWARHHRFLLCCVAVVCRVSSHSRLGRIGSARLHHEKRSVEHIWLFFKDKKR